MEANKYAKLCLFGTTKIIITHKASKRHYNKSLTMKTTTNTCKIQKFSRKVRKGTPISIRLQKLSKTSKRKSKFHLKF